MTTNYRLGKPGVFFLDHVRRLRQRSTDAEKALWSILRDRKVDSAKFRRQHQFGPYVLDFYCVEHRLVIEADGGQHFTSEGQQHDEKRTKYLEAAGLRVLRLTDTDILKNPEGVFQAIAAALVALPSPGRPAVRGSAGLSQRERRDAPPPPKTREWSR